MLSGLFCLQVAAAEQVPVDFAITQQTQLGTSVFVTGDLPALGGGDLTRAVKLHPLDYPEWKATIALPADTNFSYSYLLREDAPDRLSDPSNATWIDVFPRLAKTPPGTGPPPPSKRQIWYHSGWTAPVLHFWDGAAWQQVPMERTGPGRTASESRFVAEFPATAERDAFYLSDGAGDEDRPAPGEAYTIASEGLFLQGGHLFRYVPPATLSPPRIEVIADVFSPQLNNTRDLRVWLPRGYDENANRRYPVLYMHDGQNIFSPGGPFGSWDVGITAARLMREGRLREIIIVGVDNMGSERLVEYSPPGDGGDGDRYAQFLIQTVQPLIDGSYRTLSGPEFTGAMGSSMGGLISHYLGWEHPDVFQKLGVVSPAYARGPNFATDFATQPKRDLRISMDSGDSGTANDGLALTLEVRDRFLGLGYVLGDDLDFFIDYGAVHNEGAWAARVHRHLEYLFPVSEVPPKLPVWPPVSPTLAVLGGYSTTDLRAGQSGALRGTWYVLGVNALPVGEVQYAGQPLFVPTASIDGSFARYDLDETLLLDVPGEFPLTFSVASGAFPWPHLQVQP